MIIEMTQEDYMDYTESYCGVCLACGDIQFGGCEPDARNYKCNVCDALKVCGVEEALLSGNISLTP